MGKMMKKIITRQKPTNEDNPKCPCCEATTWKSGRTSGGKQRFRCNKCGYNFVKREDAEWVIKDEDGLVADKNKALAIQMRSERLKYREIAAALGISIGEVSRLLHDTK